MVKTSRNLVLRSGGSEAETVSVRAQSRRSLSREKSRVGVRNECCVTASVVERENGSNGAEGMLTRRGLLSQRRDCLPRAWQPASSRNGHIYHEPPTLKVGLQLDII